MSLTPKQQRFVDEYQIDLNATQAAVRAGYSEHTAAEQGYQLLQKPSVQASIAAAQDAVSKRVEVTVDDVVAGLLAEAEGKADSTAGSRVAAWAQLGKHLGMDSRNINLRLEQKPADEMTPGALAAEIDELLAERRVHKSPDEAKAEIQRPQGGIAELLEIEAKASAIDVD